MSPFNLADGPYPALGRDDDRVPRQVLVDLLADHEALLADRERLREAIRTVLADTESREGGWGPDITTVEILRSALLEQP